MRKLVIEIVEWRIAIDLQSKFPVVPLIQDPPHIANRRDSRLHW